LLKDLQFKYIVRFLSIYMAINFLLPTVKIILGAAQECNSTPETNV
jgi:hypothetical protein